MSTPDNTLRMAGWTAWGERCVWCWRKTAFSQTELDHLLPRSLKGEARIDALKLHGLPVDWDLLSQQNVAAACYACNRRKRERIPPRAPVIALLLEEAAAKAAEVRRGHEKLLGRRELEKALAVITAHGLQVVADAPGDEPYSDDLAEAVLVAATDVESATGVQVSDLHPAVRLLHSQGRWTVVRALSNEVAYVSDGDLGGVTGSHPSWACDRCGSHGPWDGNRCVRCGNLSFPDW